MVGSAKKLSVYARSDYNTEPWLCAVKEESTRERHSQKVVKRHTTGANGVEDILDWGYYRNRKIRGDGGKWDAVCAAIRSLTLCFSSLAF